jgi:DNA-binding transcriptional MerR regulator
MFRIGDFSRLTQVTIKALRHYDDLGLLRPAHVDRDTGYRYYAGGQVARLNRILALKALGLSLEQIGPLLDADLSSGQLRTMLLVKQAETTQRIEEERGRLERIQTWLRDVDEEAAACVDVVIRRVEAQRVASIRQVLPRRGDVAQLFRALAAYQQRHGLHASSWAVVWHDPDFREEEIDAEATFATTDPLPADDRVCSTELPLVETMACLVHHGAPDTIGAACRVLAQWIDVNRYQLAGPERVRLIERGPTGATSVVELQVPVVSGAG